MILRPLAKIHSTGWLLKIGDREIPFETREEYLDENDDSPERERCIGPDGLEAEHETAFLEQFGIPYPYNRETGMVDGKEVTFFCAGPPDAMLIPVYECTLHSCNYYFRDEAQEKQEREHPERRKWTKLPLEYLTNLTDLTEKQRNMLFRSIHRQLQGGEMGEFEDTSSPPQPNIEDLNNIDKLSPIELETLIGRLEAHQQWDKLKHTAREKATWFANLRHAGQAERCKHTKSNGIPCGSPAIKGDSFCHWHNQWRRLRRLSDSPLLDPSNGNASSAENSRELAAPASSDGATFEMPVLEDRLGVQLG